MGAWAHSSFSNDDALDWIAEFEEAGVPLIAETFESAAAEYLEAPDGSRIVAAAEIVAAAFGYPSSDLPEDVRSSVLSARDSIAQSPGLIDGTLRGVDRILGDKSELKALWQEAGADYDLWIESMRDLRARLHIAGRP